MDEPIVLQTTFWVQDGEVMRGLTGQSLLIGEQIWLCVAWATSADGTLHRPTRMLRVDQRAHQRLADPVWGDLLIEHAIPASAIDGREPSPGTESFEVWVDPPLSFRVAKPS